MYCPFFESKEIYCKAYALGLRIPEFYEVEHFCSGGSYRFCCWYSGNLDKEEVMNKLKDLGPIEYLDKKERKKVKNNL
jgi:hypothetical protein